MINIFDFDGVLCDPLEDAVFRLPEMDSDKEFNELGREYFRIARLTSNPKRARHLILQEYLYHVGIGCQPGPAYSKLSRHDPFFVLTARSGPGAVARVSEFFETCGHLPEEMFFVGPCSKNHHIQILCDWFPDQQLTFYDDNQHHIDEAANLTCPNLTSVHVDNNIETLGPAALELYNDVLRFLRETN